MLVQALRGRCSLRPFSPRRPPTGNGEAGDCLDDASHATTTDAVNSSVLCYGKGPSDLRSRLCAPTQQAGRSVRRQRFDRITDGTVLYCTVLCHDSDETLHLSHAAWPSSLFSASSSFRTLLQYLRHTLSVVNTSCKSSLSHPAPHPPLPSLHHRNLSRGYIRRSSPSPLNVAVDN